MYRISDLLLLAGMMRFDLLNLKVLAGINVFARFCGLGLNLQVTLCDVFDGPWTYEHAIFKHVGQISGWVRVKLALGYRLYKAKFQGSG